jgi:hypothetical protein
MSFGCPKHLEVYRVYPAGYEAQNRQNGMLQIRDRGLAVVFSDGGGWQHVSVSRRSRTPSYEDMDWIKRQFWSDDCTVMQLHVAREDHVNCHPHCLHLWRPTAAEIPRPPSIFVGPQ